MVEKENYGAVPTASADAVRNVQVVAPATLAAGYTFDASYEGTVFPVVVPEGGVSKGQRFVVPYAPPGGEPVAVAVPASPSDRAAATTAPPPTGIWRDALCDCCAHGPCHPSLLNAIWFPACLVGQLLTRMKMSWLGKREHGSDSAGNAWRNSFRNLVIVAVTFYVLDSFTAVELDDENDDENGGYELLSDSDKLKYNVNSWLTTVLGLYMFYTIVQLRATLRQVYHIPEESCTFWYRLTCTDPEEGVCPGICTSGAPVGWEDVCCAMCCQCCTLAQMARHTVDYHNKGGVCCNDVGVEPWDDDEAYEGEEVGVGEGSVLVV